MYAETDQEEQFILDNLPGPTGWFIDVGAFDGVTKSATRRLWELGWSGVLVEPSPEAFIKLSQNYPDRKRVSLLNAPVLPERRIVQFYDAGGHGVDSVDMRHVAAFRKSGAQFRKHYAVSVAPAEILEAWGPQRWRFLNIDAEGVSTDILRAFLREGVPTLDVVCVETENRKGEIVDAMNVAGFTLGLETQYNLLFSRGNQ